MHVTKNKIYKKKKLKQTNVSAHLVRLRSKIREGSREGTIQEGYGGQNSWNRWGLILEWKTEGMIDGESEGGDCDEVMRAW